METSGLCVLPLTSGVGVASEQSTSQERLEPSILIGGADAEGVVEPSVASLYLAPCVHHNLTKVPDGNESIGRSPEAVKTFDFCAYARAHTAGQKMVGPAAAWPVRGGAGMRGDRLRRGRLRGRLWRGRLASAAASAGPAVAGPAARAPAAAGPAAAGPAVGPAAAETGWRWRWRSVASS